MIGLHLSIFLEDSRFPNTSYQDLIMVPRNEGHKELIRKWKMLQTTLTRLAEAKHT